MNGIIIKCSIESPQDKNIPVKIYVDDASSRNLSYKFIIGQDGTWKTIKNFGEESYAIWVPSEEGRYIIMVQGKDVGSDKPFDYISRMEFVIGDKQERLISSFYLEKELLKVGEVLTATAQTSRSPVMFRFLIKNEEVWQVLQDYSEENKVSFVAEKQGIQEIKVECRSLDSKEAYDDFQRISFEVEKICEVEIIGFKCLSSELVVNTELEFKVETRYDESRIMLYKFMRINELGVATCIQDYSLQRAISFTENICGEYKLLCLVKDMYSNNEYDDRALLRYKIKIYNYVNIKIFITDITSPQKCGTTVLLKPIVKGGKNLLYRFIIDGNQGDDSGYSTNPTFSWVTKKPGKYKLMLWVKDVSYEGNYEATETIDFEIDEDIKAPVKIDNVIIDKRDKVLKGETINIKVFASGGSEIRYSFLVKKDNIQVEKIEFGACDWVNFIPEQTGNYELEILTKDKFSNREFDDRNTVYFEACNFIPASIDYILIPPKAYYIPGDLISMSIIARNTKDVLIKYILNINGTEVEETDFVRNKKYTFIPKYAGRYQVIFLAKNEGSNAEYDYKEEITFNVNHTPPVINTKITSDKDGFKCNENISFSVSHQGGKEVLYEFYFFQLDEWKLVQNFSSNNNYAFMPFSVGEYKILAICKSRLSNACYEDYDILVFNVEA